jgi:hypothetical protein
MDVDLSTHLSCFAPLITALASGRFDVGTGSRFLPQSSTTRCWRRQCVSATYNRLVRLYFGITFSDAQCGFKAITKAAAARLLPVIEDNGWFFDTELLVVAEKCGYRIFDLPVCWTEDRDSRVRIISTAWGDLKGILQLKRNFLDGRYSHVNAVSANAGLIGTL